MAVITKLRELNWPAVVTEVILIFIGITLALWFENANTARQQRAREAQLLLEVADALEADMRDIAGNLAEDTLTLVSIDTVLAYLGAGLPHDAALDTAFAQAAGLTIFIQNSAAYETLKTTGLDLIRDDGLRLAIVDYYERLSQSARKWEESVVVPFWQDHLNPALLRHFRYRQRKVPASPIDYAALLQDVQFRNTLDHASFNLGFKGFLYRRVHSSAETLSDEIRETLAHSR